MRIAQWGTLQCCRYHTTNLCVYVNMETSWVYLFSFNNIFVAVSELNYESTPERTEIGTLAWYSLAVIRTVSVNRPSMNKWSIHPIFPKAKSANIFFHPTNRENPKVSSFPIKKINIFPKTLSRAWIAKQSLMYFFGLSTMSISFSFRPFFKLICQTFFFES